MTTAGGNEWVQPPDEEHRLTFEEAKELAARWEGARDPSIRDVLARLDQIEAKIGALMGVPMTVDPSDDPLPVGVAPGAVKDVYEHWRRVRGKDRANYTKISPNRRRKIESRLREFSADDLCKAIDNVSRDPWPDRPMHDDITVIFRSREQVERFLEMGRLPVQANGVRLSPRKSAQQWVEAVGWQYSDADLWEELGKLDLTADDKRELVSVATRLQQENP